VSLRVGVDTGGTFTDFVCAGPRGLVVHKLRTTPDDPARAILAGLADLTGGDEADVVHGSTVATNAVLERKGARVGLLVTAGFEDVVRIGRQTRSELYNFFVPLPRPLVDPARTVGVIERLDASGRTLTPVDVGSVERAAAALAGAGAEIVAVCFLHSYANPAHERAVAAQLSRAGLRACTSHDVLPEYREFERWSTTIVNAYVTPVVDRYLARLEASIGSRRLAVMQSNGGSISASAAREQAVRVVLSGPAGGVVGAAHVAREAGFDRIVTFDMGGTSTDVSLVDRAIGTTTDSVVGDFPVRLPMIDIHTVGAGGGSLAAIDSGGALRVGPESAGSVPGPACYGSGTALTVTDANLLLGRLDPAFFLGGRMRLDVKRARDAADPVARALRVDVETVAEGVVRVANANMERAIRVVSVERGHDPRAFALVAFGGAGGMHACDLARELEMQTVLVPKHAGVLSALGMLVADVTRDYSTTVLAPLETLTTAAIDRRFAPLVKRASQELAREGFGRAHRTIARFADVRYAGQSYEITVPWSRALRREFDRRHLHRYGYADPARPAELVALRVVATGRTERPRLSRARNARAHAARPADVRPARFAQRSVKTGVFHWPDLLPGAFAAGPAVVAGPEATAVVPPGMTFRVDAMGNLVIDVRRRRRS